MRAKNKDRRWQKWIYANMVDEQERETERKHTTYLRQHPCLFSPRPLSERTESRHRHQDKLLIVSGLIRTA